MSRIFFLLATIGCASWAGPLIAGVCSVPGTHASIQLAVDDPDCGTINLADQVYPESVLIFRSLSLAGPAGVADIAGLVDVTGANTEVDFTNIKVENGCTPAAFLTSDGGHAEAVSLEVVTQNGGPCPAIFSTYVFADDFESGNTTAWTSTTF